MHAGNHWWTLLSRMLSNFVKDAVQLPCLELNKMSLQHLDKLQTLSMKVLFLKKKSSCRCHGLGFGANVKKKCNALFNKSGREATTMIASGQVYMEVLNKAINDTQRKENADTLFLSSIDVIHGSWSRR
ncbi:hypothetical protein JHK84_050746 [Glycine max]|nr:hypothetical protein JHK84_050746 [Glycine max]